MPTAETGATVTDPDTLTPLLDAYFAESADDWDTDSLAGYLVDRLQSR
ncbi:hypothetical protein [Streptomyces xanthophaeus]